MIRERLIFEISDEGKKGFSFPKLDVPESKTVTENFPLRDEIKDFPQVSELEVVRHFTRLSQTNYCIDKGIYPLGSCTMKYNPKLNEKIAQIPSFLSSHPYSDQEMMQGNLKVLKTMEDLLAEVTGMDAFTSQPAAGAQGELVGMMLIRAYLEAKGDPRKFVFIPDSAHGTNPSSAHICGYKVKEIKSNQQGTVDLDDLEKNMNEDTAAIMITNPNTLGVFENQIKEVSDLVHSQGGLVYMDGANMNALMGICRPGDMGVDVMHLNLHKTFSTPHGGGGPGAGPVGVKSILEPYLPIPRVIKQNNHYLFHSDYPKSIGRIHGFYGNFLVVVKALAYVLSQGPDGLREVSETAVLNSNYIRKSLEKEFHLEYKTPTLHECVFSDKLQKKHQVSNLDIAKRLIDLGAHPPTMSFPLIVHGALMTEPTETESKADLDLFIQAMKQIAKEAEENPEVLKSAPHHSYVRRLDEATAARNPKLRWEP
ncbi:MAG: aminotransferase class V-fold PLP-dependent enzyme [Candidatus Aminicenantes bacterium]|nr:aminotransferase class V-fold PLP-dependent enzyme [Candidatus Aminicenantes bacterium]